MVEVLRQVIKNSRVIPVITINHLEDALPLAKSLLKGGMAAIEITLRTSCALDAIQVISSHIPQCIVGAGTIIDASQLNLAIKAGARFAVSPAATEKLLAEGLKQTIPFVPGVSTPSEILKALEFGYEIVKFFPALQSGGIKMLKSYQALFPTIQFMPSGGICAASADEFLQLSNVIFIGGSWMAPQELIDGKNWDAITGLAKEASQL